MGTIESERSTEARGDVLRCTRTDPTQDYKLLLQQVRTAGLLERRVGWYVGLFVVLCLLGLLLGWGVVEVGRSWWVLLVAVGTGVVLAQFGFLAHEAGHREVFASGRSNDRAAQVIGALVVGASMTAWGRRHVRHHGHPNQVAADPSVAPGAFVFRRDDARQLRGLRRWWARRQGWFLFPVLTLAGLGLYLDGWRAVLQRGRVAGRRVELPLMLVRHVGLCSVLVWLLGVPLAAVFLGVQTAVFGLVMGGAFVPNHIGMPLVAARAKVDYLHRQVLTSRNVVGGAWLTAWMGGLDFQIEHHLFPSMARPSLAPAAEITRRFCAERGIPYVAVRPSSAYAAVMRHLNEVGLAAAGRVRVPDGAGVRQAVSAAVVIGMTPASADEDLTRVTS